MSAPLRKPTWAGPNDTISRLSPNRSSRLEPRLPKSNLQDVVTAYECCIELNKAENNGGNIERTAKIESSMRRVKTSLKCLFTGTMVVLQSRASLNFVLKMTNEERPFFMIEQPLPEARQTLTVPRSSSRKCQYLYKCILRENLSASEVIGIGAGSSYRPNYDSTKANLQSAVARPLKTLVFRF